MKPNQIALEPRFLVVNDDDHTEVWAEGSEAFCVGYIQGHYVAAPDSPVNFNVIPTKQFQKKGDET